MKVAFLASSTHLGQVGASAETGLQYGRQRNSHPNEPYFSDFSPLKYGSPG